MTLRTNSNRPWYVDRTGTKYTRDPERKREDRPKELNTGKLLVQFMTSEAKGDLALAAILATRNLLRDERAWFPTGRARTAANMACDPTSPQAVKFNILGALEHVTFQACDQKYRREIVKMIMRCLPKTERNGDACSPSLSVWEAYEGRFHTQMLHLLNMAIAARKTEM